MSLEVTYVRSAAGQLRGSAASAQWPHSWLLAGARPWRLLNSQLTQLDVDLSRVSALDRSRAPPTSEVPTPAPVQAPRRKGTRKRHGLNCKHEDDLGLEYTLDSE